MTSVKSLIAVLGADDQITALRKAMASSMHRFQISNEMDSDWAKWAGEKLTTSVKVSVVGNEYACSHTYDLLLQDDPSRVGIDILASMKVDNSEVLRLPRQALERYFKVTKERCLFRSPLTKEYGSVVGPYNVFTLLCFTPLEEQLNAVISTGFVNGEEEFLERVRSYFKLLNECLSIAANRYGKSYIGVIVDSPDKETLSVLRPEVFKEFLMGEITILDTLKEETRGPEVLRTSPTDTPEETQSGK